MESPQYLQRASDVAATLLGGRRAVKLTTTVQLANSLLAITVSRRVSCSDSRLVHCRAETRQLIVLKSTDSEWRLFSQRGFVLFVNWRRSPDHSEFCYKVYQDLKVNNTGFNCVPHRNTLCVRIVGACDDLYRQDRRGLLRAVT